MEFLEYTKNTTFLFQLSVEQIAEATGLTTESYHTVGPHRLLSEGSALDLRSLRLRRTSWAERRFLSNNKQ